MSESDASPDAILAAVLELAQRQLERLDDPPRLARTHEIGPDTRLVEDLELDSLRLLSLAMEIEDRFLICLDPEDEEGLVTVADVVSTIETKLRHRDPTP